MGIPHGHMGMVRNMTDDERAKVERSQAAARVNAAAPPPEPVPQIQSVLTLLDQTTEELERRMNALCCRLETVSRQEPPSESATGPMEEFNVPLAYSISCIERRIASVVLVMGEMLDRVEV